MARNRLAYVVALTTILVTVAVLNANGRTLICPCGHVRLWFPETATGENSQHLLDWYTPSHLIHGLVFFGALWLVARPLPVSWRYAIAVLVEATWEIIENSPAVIRHYRENTMSLDYNGDAIINSLSDIFAMTVAFALARVIPVWLSVALAVGFEAAAAIAIRDGLVLNILTFVYPVQSILLWQTGG